MFTQSLLNKATQLLQICREHNIKITTVESCTGGLVSGLLTEIAGSSDVVDRGYVTYSNAAKIESVGVPEHLIATHGAVSEKVAIAMAEGGLLHSNADLCVALTGVAGPGGGSLEKPVGLVHLAVAVKNNLTRHERCLFDPSTRSDIRQAAVTKALEMLYDATK
jgi:nicotinamide-nucleotide amidase